MTEISRENYLILEKCYLTNFPSNIPDEVLKNYKTIIEFKELIKNSIPEKRILNNILDVAITKINNKERFQKILFIKIIRKQIKPEFVDEKITEKLFYIFQSLLNEVNSDISWSLSFLIKDIKLTEDNIKWLIENCDKSEHIINRLLRYPFPNEKITKWGKTCFKNIEFKSRLSELISLQLNFDKNYSHKDKNALLWGIHYSKLDDKTKKNLLINKSDNENFISLIKICKKNNFMDVIENIYLELNKITK